MVTEPVYRSRWMAFMETWGIIDKPCSRCGVRREALVKGYSTTLRYILYHVPPLVHKAVVRAFTPSPAAELRLVGVQVLPPNPT